MSPEPEESSLPFVVKENGGVTRKRIEIRRKSLFVFEFRLDHAEHLENSPWHKISAGDLAKLAFDASVALVGGESAKLAEALDPISFGFSIVHPKWRPEAMERLKIAMGMTGVVEYVRAVAPTLGSLDLGVAGGRLVSVANLRTGEYWARTSNGDWHAGRSPSRHEDVLRERCKRLCESKEPGGRGIMRDGWSDVRGEKFLVDKGVVVARVTNVALEDGDPPRVILEEAGSEPRQIEIDMDAAIDLVEMNRADRAKLAEEEALNWKEEGGRLAFTRHGQLAYEFCEDGTMTVHPSEGLSHYMVIAGGNRFVVIERDGEPAAYVDPEDLTVQTELKADIQSTWVETPPRIGFRNLRGAVASMLGGLAAVIGGAALLKKAAAE